MRSFVRSLSILILLTLSALRVDAQSRRPDIQNRVRLDPNVPVGFHVAVIPDSVYVGQQATYEMGVFISASAQQRMRRNPEVVPAELRGLLAYDLGGPQSLSPISVGEQRFIPHVLQRALFGISPGSITIPASQLNYALPRTASYFSREEAVLVKANDVVINVLPLPVEGRPDRFSGAVGIINIGAVVDSVLARAGDAVVLTVRVSGRGNVKLWPRPELMVEDASLVVAGDRAMVDSTGQYISGTREFDWILTPEREGPLVIPSVEYSFFDPYRRQYLTVRSDSIVMDISAGDFVENQYENVLGQDTPSDEDQNPDGNRSDRTAIVWWVVLLALVLSTLIGLRIRSRNSRSGKDIVGGNDSKWRKTRGLYNDESSTEDFRVIASLLRSDIIDSISTIANVPASDLMGYDSIVRNLRYVGVSRITAEQVSVLMETIDKSVWGSDNRNNAETEISVWKDKASYLLSRARSESISAATSQKSEVERSV